MENKLDGATYTIRMGLAAQINKIHSYYLYCKDGNFRVHPNIISSESPCKVRTFPSMCKVMAAFEMLNQGFVDNLYISRDFNVFNHPIFKYAIFFIEKRFQRHLENPLYNNYSIVAKSQWFEAQSLEAKIKAAPEIILNKEHQ